MKRAILFASLVLADEPGSTLPAEIHVESHRPAAGAIVTLLGSTTPLKWRPEGNGFVALIPPGLRAKPPSRHASVLKVSRLAD